MAEIKITLVEDHPEYRESLALALSYADGIQLAHKFGTAEQALHFLEYEAIGQMPDLILLDLNLPGMNGIEAIPWLKKQTPKTPIMILTQSDREADVITAIAAGASGYLLKSATRNQLTDAIRLVIEGGAPLDPNVAKYILNKLHTPPRKKTDTIALTEREIDVLTQLAEGLVKKQIAERLNISSHTVDNHIRHIYEKLQVPNAPAAVNKAHHLGLFRLKNNDQ